jgi:hypothetical protein
LLTDNHPCVASRCSIAMMDACNEFMLGQNARSLESLRYLSQALASINERLRGDEALSDSTLTLVLHMIIYQQLRCQMAEAQIHYAGLQRMIELRGGLSQLEGNAPLLLKICKCAQHVPSRSAFCPSH